MAHPGANRTHPGTIEAHPAELKAHSGIVEAHPGAMQSFTLGIEQWRKRSCIESTILQIWCTSTYIPHVD